MFKLRDTWLAALLIAAILAVGPRGPSAPGPADADLGSIYPPPSWAVANWYVDPANSSAAASDNNTCTSSGAPCLTWKEIIRRYGTYEPVLRQNTTVTFLSSHSDDTDPVIWRPYIAHGALVILQGSIGASQQVASGTISSLTAKNRATPQLLQATFPAGVAANQLAVNSTHSSRAWIYAQVSGNTYSVSQPLAPYVPGTTFTPTEVDTWANTDTVTLYTPVAVNVSEFRPKSIDGNASVFNEYGYIYQLNLFNPASLGDQALFGTNVAAIESEISRGVRWDTSADSGVLSGLPQANDNFRAGTAGGTGIFLPSGDSRFWIFGGISNFAPNLDTGYLDYDIILVNGALMRGGNLGDVYVESGATLTIVGFTNFQRHKGPSNIMWGPGGLNVTGSARLVYPSGGSQAAAAFKITGGIQMNGGSVACSIGTGASATVNCGISPTAAHLDAAVGTAGFGGVAFVPGGASITNLSP